MDAVSYYIAKDMLPLDMVGGEGVFMHGKEFEPRYNPLGRKALTTHYFDKIVATTVGSSKSFTQGF